MAAFIAPVVGGIASLVGGILGSNAASKAGNNYNRIGQAAGTAMYNNTATAVGDVQGATAQGQAGIGSAVTGAQNYMSGALGTANAGLANVFQGQTANLSPYLNLGSTAANSFSNAMAPGGALQQTFNPNSVQGALNTQGLQFQQQQGMQAIQNSAAARGLSQSGATMKAMNDYSQGLASTYYQNAFNNQLQSYQTNFQNALNANTAAANVGLNASGQYNQAAMNFGNLYSSNNMNAAQYMGNAGLTGAESSAQLGEQGGIASGQLQLNGANMANNYYMMGAQGQASGILGSGQAWQGALNGMAGALSGGLTAAFGGGSPSMSSMMNLPVSNPYTSVTGIGNMLPYMPTDGTGYNVATNNVPL